MNTEIVNFHGDELFVSIDEDGTKLVAVRPICLSMGLSWPAQYKKLQEDQVLSTCVVLRATQLPGDTQVRTVTFLPLDFLTGWLFKINPNKVAPEAKSKIIQYQVECYRVLHDYWTKGIALSEETAKKATEDPEWFMAKALLYAQEKLAKQEVILEEQKNLIDSAMPKVSFYDQYADANGLHMFTDAAKLLGISGILLGRFVRTKGFAWQSTPLTWTQPFINKGYGSTKTWQTVREDGTTKTGNQAMLTSSGIMFLLEQYTKEYELAELAA